jgi:hypothetical protein
MERPKMRLKIHPDLVSPPKINLDSSEEFLGPQGTTLRPSLLHRTVLRHLLKQRKGQAVKRIILGTS